jgi:hypothetical protein
VTFDLPFWEVRNGSGSAEFSEQRRGHFRLYEWISEMKKGSPSGYDAETGKGRDAENQNRLRRKNFRTTGDRPAVPRRPGDWAEELLLPMLLTVCIEAGRQTLTHTSCTGSAHGSRKWMSGQAAALAPNTHRRTFANSTAILPLREPTLPSVRRPPSPLDFYLSWMSPNFRQLLFSASVSRKSTVPAQKKNS